MAVSSSPVEYSTYNTLLLSGQDPTSQVSDDPPCQSEACAIQDCLMAKHYQETRCQDVIDRLYQCCDKMIKQNGTSTACPKPSVVDRKLREIKERK